MCYSVHSLLTWHNIIHTKETWIRFTGSIDIVSKGRNKKKMRSIVMDIIICHSKLGA